MKIEKGKYIKEISTGMLIKITSDGNKSGWVRGNGYKIAKPELLSRIEAGTYAIVDSPARNGKVAKLVTVGLMVRVIVPENATDDEVIAAAAPKLADALNNDLYDNVEEIVDDLVVPYGSGYQE